MALTKRAVDALKFDAQKPGKQVLWDVGDGAIKGLGVRVFASGAKSLVVQYRVGGGRNGRQRLLTIGRYGVLTVDQARARATTELAKVVGGGDPLADLEHTRATPKLKAVATEYLTKSKGRLKPRTIAAYELLLRKHLHNLGGKLISDITTRDVSKLHHAMHKTPMAANRTIDFLGTVLLWCESQGYRPPNSNPCTVVQRFPEKGRERFLSVAETAALGEALTTALTSGLPPAPQHRRKPGKLEKQKHRPKTIAVMPANPFAIACIRFLLLSGWRLNEAQTLRWADVDFERRSATLPNTKTGVSHRPLGAPALALLADLPRVEGNVYVFAGEAPGTHIRDIKRVWGAVRHAAGLDDVRIHDLRHTVASFSAASGYSLHITGKLLGHKRASTTEKYAHLHDDVRHAAANVVSEAIADAMRMNAS